MHQLKMLELDFFFLIEFDLMVPANEYSAILVSILQRDMNLFDTMSNIFHAQSLRQSNKEIVHHEMIDEDGNDEKEKNDDKEKNDANRTNDKKKEKETKDTKETKETKETNDFKKLTRLGEQKQTTFDTSSPVTCGCFG